MVECAPIERWVPLDRLRRVTPRAGRVLCPRVFNWEFRNAVAPLRCGAFLSFALADVAARLVSVIGAANWW